MLIGGRAIQGIGGAGLLNGAFITIAAAAPKDKKPRKDSLQASYQMFLTVHRALSIRRN
jgi:hypothetical protein